MHSPPKIRNKENPKSWYIADATVQLIPPEDQASTWVGQGQWDRRGGAELGASPHTMLWQRLSRPLPTVKPRPWHPAPQLPSSPVDAAKQTLEGVGQAAQNFFSDIGKSLGGGGGGDGKSA